LTDRISLHQPACGEKVLRRASRSMKPDEKIHVR
jgi:hypothetical protein